MRRIRFSIAATIVIGLLYGAWYLCWRDYAGEFRDRKGALAEVRQSSSERDSLRDIRWLTLYGSGGLKVECGMIAPRGEGRVPAIILLGGKRTGKRAVDYVPGIPGAVVVAVDYPYETRHSYSLVSFLADVPAMRRALLDMVPSVMLLTDYLYQRPDVDTSRIVLLGYSFGAQLIPVIASLDRRTAVAIMAYGGGDLRRLISHNVARYEGEILGDVVALLGSFLLSPLEPMRYVEHISPTPFLMVNGVSDEQIPAENARLLYDAARDPKRIVWIESRHVHTTNEELTRRIVEVIRIELGSFGIRINSGE